MFSGPGTTRLTIRALINLADVNLTGREKKIEILTLDKHVYLTEGGECSKYVLKERRILQVMGF